MLSKSSLIVILMCALWGSPASSGSRDFLIYISTHTDRGSKGIFAAKLDVTTGQLRSIGWVWELQNPFFVAAAPDHKHLYAVTITDGHSTDTVTSLAIEPLTGKLTKLNSVSSRGVGACHFAIDRSQKLLALANYTDGKVAVFTLEPDGRVGPSTAVLERGGSSVNRARQEGPHPHAVVLSPDEHFAFVPDLGLDQIRVYSVDARSRKLEETKPGFVSCRPGSGPRHMVFGPGGKFAYVANELDSTVSVFSYDAAHGSLTSRQNVALLPADFKGSNTAAEIGIDPAGHFLYASNRGHDSITVFSIRPSTGLLTLAGRIPSGGREPWDFKIDPTGAFLLVANKESNNLVCFRIDPRTGLARPMKKPLEIPGAVSIAFVGAETK